tara:strand:+ start:420 stop:698 length:279 start_codon:yes stop_codon:yes gene_type:complete
MEGVKKENYTFKVDPDLLEKYKELKEAKKIKSVGDEINKAMESNYMQYDSDENLERDLKTLQYRFDNNLANIDHLERIKSIKDEIESRLRND